MEKERKTTVAITWRVSPEMKQRFIQEFGSSSSNAVSDTIINAYYKVVPSLQSKIVELEKTLKEGGSFTEGVPESEHNAVKMKLAALESADKEKEDNINVLSQQLQELQAKLEEKEDELEKLKASEEGLIPVYVTNEKVRTFLDTVKYHLEEKYGREVTFYEIFVMSTLLYNVEKRCDWFYPPLKDSKIEEVTGKTIKEWKAFLSQKEK